MSHRQNFFTDRGCVMDEQTWILTAADRCDQCGAQAYVQATVSKRELLFCAHDYATHADKLFDIGAQIIDERARLNVKLDASA